MPSYPQGHIRKNDKAIVATNAIKHGIFTNGLLVSSEVGQESKDEYQALLDNLIECLLPCNQMESLLVEKIAVDFWRLRRTIRFETGSIINSFQTLLKEFILSDVKMTMKSKSKYAKTKIF